MTLYRQLVIAVATLFILLYGVNVVVGVYHTRELVEQQMQVHSQDTATSVALSMTQAAREKDFATLDTMFNAVSDSGYFRQMTYRNLQGDTLIDRLFPVDIEGVPDWFIESVTLPSPEGRAEVASGWIRLGDLVVISHPGQAYNKLWQVTKDQLTWFALVTVLVCLLAAYALRVILKPLSRVEKQAHAICDKQFIVQETIPRTRELRSVVVAMNRMAMRLKSIFESQLDLIAQLQEQSLRDSVTGLSNRLDFDTRLKSFVRPETGPVSGALMILAVDAFERVNDKAGRSEGNAILKHIAEKLSKAVEAFPQSIVARRQGPEFTLFVPNLMEEEARSLAQTVFESAAAVEWRCQDEDPLKLFMGFTYAIEVLDPVEMLREADLSMRQASEVGSSGWRGMSDVQGGGDAPVLSDPAVAWRETLEKAIQDKSPTLLYQPIYTARRKLIGHEIYSRLPSGDNLITAGIFMPLAERFGLAPEFDKLALSLLAKRANKFPAKHYICVNMSVSSIQDRDFIRWLDQFLGQNKAVTKRLVVELPEHAMHIEERYIRDLSALLSSHKVRLGIDHFGLESSAFGYLGSLNLHHIKIHRSFVHGIEDNSDNRFYIQSLMQVARSRDIHLTVEGVEDEAAWNTLVELGVDAGQGYLLGEPSPTPVKK